jgi:heme O synthase-like polyprenyltransferase
MICITIALGIFGVQANTGVNSGALVGSAFAVSMWFCSKNKRQMDSSESRAAVVGMLAIDLALQVVMALGIGAVGGTKLPVGPLLIATAFIGLLHGVGIYFMVSFAGKQYAKQVARVA